MRARARSGTIDTMVVRVVLVDDHKIMREGLRAILERDAEMQVVGEAGDGRAGARMAGDLEPDLVVMDVAMQGMNGVEATRQILADRPAARVLALSMHCDGRFIREMLRAGAAGYMLKDCAGEELATAIRSVLEGQIYLSPNVNDSVLRDYIEQLSGVQAPPISPRESEVLQLVAEGKTTGEIAGLLHVSVKTVESHRKQLMDKLGIRNIAGLTKYAVRVGLTDLE